jgi:RNA-binding protein YlmH
MYGKPEVAASLAQPLPKRRKQKADMRGVDIDAIHRKPLERDVLKAIVQVLRLDRRVARVERNHSRAYSRRAIAISASACAESWISPCT